MRPRTLLYLILGVFILFVAVSVLVMNNIDQACDTPFCGYPLSYNGMRLANVLNFESTNSWISHDNETLGEPGFKVCVDNTRVLEVTHDNLTSHYDSNPLRVQVKAECWSDATGMIITDGAAMVDVDRGRLYLAAGKHVSRGIVYSGYRPILSRPFGSRFVIQFLSFLRSNTLTPRITYIIHASNSSQLALPYPYETESAIPDLEKLKPYLAVDITLAAHELSVSVIANGETLATGFITTWQREFTVIYDPFSTLATVAVYVGNEHVLFDSPPQFSAANVFGASQRGVVGLYAHHLPHRWFLVHSWRMDAAVGNCLQYIPPDAVCGELPASLEYAKSLDTRNNKFPLILPQGLSRMEVAHNVFSGSIIYFALPQTLAKQIAQSSSDSDDNLQSESSPMIWAQGCISLTELKDIVLDASSLVQALYQFSISESKVNITLARSLSNCITLPANINISWVGFTQPECEDGGGTANIHLNSGADASELVLSIELDKICFDAELNEVRSTIKSRRTVAGAFVVAVTLLGAVIAVILLVRRCRSEWYRYW